MGRDEGSDNWSDGEFEGERENEIERRNDYDDDNVNSVRVVVIIIIGLDHLLEHRHRRPERIRQVEVNRTMIR